MADKSSIEWTDATWNPIAGCSIVSPGCTNCYAMRQADRVRQMNGPESHYFGTTKIVNGHPVWTGAITTAPDTIFLKPLTWRRPRRIFVNSMSDLFHDAVPDAVIDRVFAIMALCPQHDFQLLTKRPERMRAYVTALSCCDWQARLGDTRRISLATASRGRPPWPLPNVWLGVSVEDQRRADERIPILLDTPSAVRWISAEPLLGKLELTKIPDPTSGDGVIDALAGTRWIPGCGSINSQTVKHSRLEWVVVGGESGRNARPMHPDAPRSLRDQCVAAGVPLLFKQWGEWATSAYLMSTGEPIFRQFQTFDHWVNKASTWINGGICLDKHGNRLEIGADFMRARDRGSFPVTIMHRVGKKAAGRMLDGVVWDQYPEVRT